MIQTEKPSQVLQVAAELHARDRLQIEERVRHQELLRAAAEVGLPAEYIEQAVAAIRLQRITAARRQRLRMAGLAMALSLLVGWGVNRRLGSHALRSTGFGIAGAAIPRHGAANLEGRDLHGVSLVSANLSAADLRRADLSGANLQCALLTAHLEGANLSGANLKAAILCAAVLTGANLTNARLTGAVYNQKTRWPAGFDPVRHGAVLIR